MASLVSFTAIRGFLGSFYVNIEVGTVLLVEAGTFTI
jgi:hypothetical protein